MDQDDTGTRGAMLVSMYEASRQFATVAAAPARPSRVLRWEVVFAILLSMPIAGLGENPAAVVTSEPAPAAISPQSAEPRAETDAALALYAQRGQQPLWLDAAGRPTHQALAVLAAFEGAADHGLETQAYAPDLLRWARDAPGQAAFTHERFDFPLTVATMRYAQHLHGGRVDPRRFEFEFDSAPNRLDLGAVVSAIAGAADPYAALEDLEPRLNIYHRLQAQMPRYRALAREFTGNTIPPPAQRVLEPGAGYAGVAQLSRLLEQLGDLPGNAVEALPPPARYEGALVEAVRHFQRRHGLEVDGRIGPGTLAALNTPLQQRVEQISLAMERLRWVPPLGARPPIAVNIPEFRLRAFDEQRRIVLEMKVVVGRATSSRTPVFAGDLATVVFRPYWNVPPSIARELGPGARKGFERINGALRQRPGPDNALGLVKFLFPNHHSVYLHDTPADALFGRARRDFSHGCIRVEDPAALAAWVLRDDPAWTPERIAAAMNGKRDDISVAVVPPIPVYIFYVTAVVDEAGEISFFEDVYGHDATLARALRAQAASQRPAAGPAG